MFMFTEWMRKKKQNIKLMKFNESKNCGYNGQCCRSQELRKEKRNNRRRRKKMFIAKMLNGEKIDQKKLYCIIEIRVD